MFDVDKLQSGPKVQSWFEPELFWAGSFLIEPCLLKGLRKLGSDATLYGFLLYVTALLVSSVDLSTYSAAVVTFFSMLLIKSPCQTEKNQQKQFGPEPGLWSYIWSHLKIIVVSVVCTWISSSMAISVKISCSSWILDSREIMSWWQDSISLTAWLVIWPLQLIWGKRPKNKFYNLHHALHYSWDYYYLC